MRGRGGAVLPTLTAVLLAASASAAGERLFEDVDLSRVALPAAPLAMAAADFDAGGGVDLAVVHEAERELRVLRSAAGGSFSPADVYTVGVSPIFVHSADLDGDGLPELLAVNSGSSSVSLLRNLGASRFAKAVEVQVDLNPRAVATGDVDGDGSLDAVSISRMSGRDLGVFTTLAGDGTGSLRRARAFTVGDNPHSLALSDFDLDGHLDVAVAHTSTISWFRGRGDGIFHPAVRTAVTGNPRTLAAGDFNRDGRTDLAVTTDLDGDGALDAITANGESSDLRVLPGRRAPPGTFRRGDADGDGTASITDAIAILESLFRGAGELPCPDAGDMDDDGVLLLTDAVTLLGFLFQQGAPPSDPGPSACGEDPTADGLKACDERCR